MGGKYSWIVLFVTLQISVVLCRSTEKPKDEVKVVHEGPILFPHGQASVVKTVDQYFADNFGEPTPESPVPNVLTQDHEKGTFFSPLQARISANTRIGVIIGVLLFILGSLIVGFILCCCFPSKPRPGIILSTNSAHAQYGIQHHGNNLQQSP